MRFFCVAKSDEKTEAGIPPSPEIFETMGSFVEEQMKSGVLRATGRRQCRAAAIGTRMNVRKTEAEK